MEEGGVGIGFPGGFFLHTWSPLRLQRSLHARVQCVLRWIVGHQVEVTKPSHIVN